VGRETEGGNTGVVGGRDGRGENAERGGMEEEGT
jgi:hypothetical protein